MGTIANMNVKLAMDAADFDRGISQVQAKADGLAQGLGKLGTGMSLAVTAPLVGIAGTAINSAADFEQSMNVMEQVTGANTAQMAQMQAQALNLGAVTSFSAGEAAQAMLELGKAGMAPNEIMAAIGGTMDLAAAGGMGLAQAAEISANAVNTFGLEASDATRVANMLAAAANASSVEVTDLGEGMKMAGAVFSAAGQSIDDLNIAMALLGNNGIKGSDAGTSLKTALMRLTAPTDQAAGMLQNLGVQVYDAQGNMREFPVILADLQRALYGANQVTVSSSNLTGEQAARMEYLQKTIAGTQTKLANYASGMAGIGQSAETNAAAQDKLRQTLAAAQAEYDKLASAGSTTSTVVKTLTEEERQQALATIFGADAIRSVSVLLSEGTDGWNEMAGALGVAGAATDVANARMKGMNGAIEYLKGSIDSFLITAALPLLDSMSGMVRWVADLISMIGNMPEPMRNMALAVAAVAAATGPVLLIVSKLIPVFGMLGTALGLVVSPVGLLVAAVGALVAVFVTDFMGVRTAVAGMVKNLLALAGVDLDGVADGLRSFGNYLGAVAEDGDYLNDWLTHLPEPIQPAVQALGQLVAAFAGLGGGDIGAFIQSITEIDWGGALASVGESLGLLASGMASALGKIPWAEAIAAAGDWLGKFTGQVVAAVGAIPWATLLAAAGDFLAGLWSSVTNALGKIPWAAALTSTAGWLDGLTTNVIAAISGFDWGGALAAAGDVFGGLETAAANGLRALGFADAATALDGLKTAVTGLQGVWSTAWPAIQSAATGAWNAIASTFSAAWMWLQTTLPAALSALRNIWSTAWPALQSAVSTAWGAIQPALSAAWGWLQVNLPVAIGGLQAIWTAAWPAIQSAVSTAWGIIQPALSGAWSWLQVNLPVAIGGLQAIWTAAWPVIQGAVTTAWGLIQPALAALQGALAGLPGSVSGASAQFGTFWAQLTAIGATVAAFFAPAIERVQTAFAGLPASLAPILPELGELGAAFGGLLQAVQPLLLAIGAGLAIVADFGINALAAEMNNLPGIVGPIIEQVTATIRLITTVLTEVVAAVKGVIDGDWTTVWASAQTIAGEFNTFFRGLFSRLGTFMGAVAKNITKPIIDTLTDLGVDITPHLEAVRKTFDDIWTKIKGYIQPVIDIIASLQEKLTTFGEWLGTLSLPNPFEGILGAANAVQSALGAAGNFVSGGGADGDPNTPGRATGGPVLAGGRYLVGERGPEMFVPSRAGSIVPTRELGRALDDRGENTPQQPTVVFNGTIVNNEIDVFALANRVAQLLVA